MTEAGTEDEAVTLADSDAETAADEVADGVAEAEGATLAGASPTVN